jgi:pimeloyl-ACP methyl ester carboxylesterase
MYARAEVLIARGYGVLLIDLPGHGQSGGTPTWDEQERNAVRRAIDFCQQQPGVSKRGVLAIGFSSGAYILAQVAATETRLAGIVLEGCYTSIGELVNWQYRRYGWISRYPALWTDRHYGMKSDDIQPINVVRRIAPIATFLIAGTEDRVVPAVMVKELYAAAREPKELWLVDGAGHGDYQRVAPAEYARRIATFLEAAWTQKGQ